MSARSLLARLPFAGALRGAVHAWRERALEARVAAFYRTVLRPGDLVFDIGANVGTWTAAFRRVGARVIAVEPQGTCLARLRGRFAGDAQVVLVPNAVGERAGEVVELRVCDQAPTISTASSSWREHGRFAGQFDWTRTERVTTTTLDQLIASHGAPAYVKIDVEGFEPQVVRGLSRPLPLLSVEFAREFAPDTAACLRHLAELGPIEVNFSRAETFAFAFDAWLEPAAFLARLAAIEDPLLWGDAFVRPCAGRQP